MEEEAPELDQDILFSEYTPDEVAAALEVYRIFKGRDLTDEECDALMRIGNPKYVLGDTVGDRYGPSFVVGSIIYSRFFNVWVYGNGEQPVYVSEIDLVKLKEGE